jgi:hypothetical protein
MTDPVILDRHQFQKNHDDTLRAAAEEIISTNPGLTDFTKKIQTLIIENRRKSLWAVFEQGPSEFRPDENQALAIKMKTGIKVSIYQRHLENCKCTIYCLPYGMYLRSLCKGIDVSDGSGCGYHIMVEYEKE